MSVDGSQVAQFVGCYVCTVVIELECALFRTLPRVAHT